MMCHRIEDPTFDATAVATNPRAQMRPIHRPPRVPADRHPHCHWTIKIEPGATPVVEEPLTLTVGRLPLARVANEAPPDREPGGWRDYAGPFDPDFRLERLSHGALVGALREFSLQTYLLAASASLFLSERHERAKVREVLTQQWIGANWIAAERIAALRGLGGGMDAIAEVLALHPAFPPGIEMTIGREGEQRIALRLAAPAELLGPDAPGWLGLLGAGEGRPLEAIAQALNPHTRLVEAAPGAFTLALEPGAEPVKEPQPVTLTRLSTAAAWRFRDLR